MTDLTSIYSDTRVAHKRWIAPAMLAAWLGIVSVLAWTHLVWRDEVRALSLALQGDSVFAMLKGIHGEGHPAIWYLLLRGAHALVPHPEVLQLLSIVIAAAAMVILLLRSPFSLPVLALILISAFSVYEYSVMARNYGISMLLLFLFAVFYEQHRERDCLLGVLLFLLANCNVPSAIDVGGLLLLWFVDVLSSETTDKLRRVQIFLYNASLATLGVMTCFVTVFPTFNDAAIIDVHTVTIKTLMKAAFLPSLQFRDSCALPGAARLVKVVPSLGNPLVVLQSLILFGSTLGLIRRIGAFLAALTTLVGFSLYFAVIYPGSYRHQALWLVFMISLNWLATPRDAQGEFGSHASVKPFVRCLATGGTTLFVFVILLQLPSSARKIFGVMSAPTTALENRKNNIRSILAGHPELHEAVVIADPDFLLETLPYYVSNPTYLMREQRYGNVGHFTRKAKLELSLGDVLTDARRLRQETGRPVVILLSHQIDPSLPAQVYEEGYDWEFIITPEQARDFRASTRFITHRPPAETSEEFDVFAMDKE